MLAEVAFSRTLSNIQFEAAELINYQGRMLDGGQLVNGTTQIIFRIYDDPTTGTVHYAETQTITIVDGLYATSIGLSNTVPGALSSALTNTAAYLELQVGAEPLTPRERIVSVAYALMANELPPGALSGAMISSGAVESLHIADGTIAVADLSPSVVSSFSSDSSWSISGNSGTADGTNFLGTVDNVPVEIRVNNERVFRFEPAPFSGPRMIGGYSGNSAAAGLDGVTISGGGRLGTPNIAIGAYATIGGGRGGVAAQSSSGLRRQSGAWHPGQQAFVGGGFQCLATNLRSVVIGGQDNVCGGRDGFVGGGLFNEGLGERSVISGGSFNETTGLDATVPGGSANHANGKLFVCGRTQGSCHK